MGKGDRPSPPPPQLWGILDIQIHPNVRGTVTVNGEPRETDDIGYLRIGRHRYDAATIEVTAPNLRTEKFEHKFDLPLVVMPIFLTPKPGELFGDCLTCHDKDDNIIYTDVYPLYDDAMKARCIEAIKLNKYTDTFVSISYSARNNDPVLKMEDYDLLNNPQLFNQACKDYANNGIRSIALIGYQKGLHQLAKHGSFGDFRDKFTDFVVATRDNVTGYCLGLEASEFWTWDEIIELMLVIHQHSSGIVGVHLGHAEWGPSPWGNTSKRERSWWGYLRGLMPDADLHLFYQARHFPQDTKYGRGFSTPNERMRTDIEELVEPFRLGDLNVKVIDSEHGYLIGSEQTKRLGDIAKKAGAHGRMNGGNIL